jgi:putative PIN family toxin of toxin-antitoxin system
MLIEEEVLPFFEIIEIADKVRGICRDSDDDMVIACAVAAKADFIVSGDKDLLVIKKYKSVRIINALDLLRMF